MKQCLSDFDDEIMKDYFLNMSIVTRIIINLGVIIKSKNHKLNLKVVSYV